MLSRSFFIDKCILPHVNIEKQVDKLTRPPQLGLLMEEEAGRSVLE